jgi:hypothetical protein
MAEANICTICQISVEDGREYLKTKCKHVFHTECIAKNANINNNKCPNCRSPIPSFQNIFTGYQNTKKDQSTGKIISNDVCVAGHFGIQLSLEYYFLLNINLVRLKS